MPYTFLIFHLKLKVFKLRPKHGKVVGGGVISGGGGGGGLKPEYFCFCLQGVGPISGRTYNPHFTVACMEVSLSLLRR